MVRREKWLPLSLLLSRCLLTWNCKLQIAFSAVGLIKILRHESANLYGPNLSKPTLFDVTISGSDDFWQPAKINWDLRYGRENGDAPNRDNVIKSSPGDTWFFPVVVGRPSIRHLVPAISRHISEFYFSWCEGTSLTEIIFSTFSKRRSRILIFFILYYLSFASGKRLPRFLKICLGSLSMLCWIVS